VTQKLSKEEKKDVKAEKSDDHLFEALEKAKMVIVAKPAGPEPKTPEPEETK